MPFSVSYSYPTGQDNCTPEVLRSQASHSSVRKHVDRHGFDLLGLKPAFESGHHADASLVDRLEDRGAIGAVEIQSRLGQVCRAESNDAGAVFAVAVEAIAGGIVLEQHSAAGRLGCVCPLTAELEHILDHV